MTTKQQNIIRLYERLSDLGFTSDEINELCKIERTLSRWSEAECNGEIERNETTGKPERVSRAYINGASSTRHAWPVADREAGALKRLGRIMASRKRRLIAYQQGDPRGCALYIVRRSDIPRLDRAEWLARNPVDKSEAAYRRANARQVESYYTRGVAVCG